MTPALIGKNARSTRIAETAVRMFDAAKVNFRRIEGGALSHAFPRHLSCRLLHGTSNDVRNGESPNGNPHQITQ